MVRSQDTVDTSLLVALQRKYMIYFIRQQLNPIVRIAPRLLLNHESHQAADWFDALNMHNSQLGHVKFGAANFYTDDIVCCCICYRLFHLIVADRVCESRRLL